LQNKLEDGILVYNTAYSIWVQIRLFYMRYALLEHSRDPKQWRVAESTGKVTHITKSGWWFLIRKIRVVELGWQQMRSGFYI